jgi:O-antigen ligase
MYFDLYRPQSFSRRAFLVLYSAGCLVMLYKGYVRGGVVTLGAWLVIWSLVYRKLHWGIAAAVLIIGADLMLQGQLGQETRQLFDREVAYQQGELEDDRRVLNGRGFVWEQRLSRWSELEPTYQIFGGTSGGGSHNELLRVLLSAGLLGLFIFIGVIGVISIWVIRRFFSTGRRSRVAIYGLMLLAMYYIEAIGSTPGLHIQYQWYVFGLIGACLLNDGRYSLTSWRRISPVGGPVRHRGPPPAPAFGGVAPTHARFAGSRSARRTSNMRKA